MECRTINQHHILIVPKTVSPREPHNGGSHKMMPKMQEMLCAVRRAELLTLQDQGDRIEIFDVLEVRRSKYANLNAYLAHQETVHPIVQAFHHRARRIADNRKERISKVSPISPDDRK